jgi:hypothetical protein
MDPLSQSNFRHNQAKNKHVASNDDCSDDDDDDDGKDGDGCF